MPSLPLRKLYEDPISALSNWNSLDENPCDWTGICCSMARDRTIKLILQRNSFIGIIPKEIGSLKYLRVLDLGMNKLSGPILPEIGNLTCITKVNLQSNGLTGRLPLEIGNLKYLGELRLDRNKLQGTFPGSNGSRVKSCMECK